MTELDDRDPLPQPPESTDLSEESPSPLEPTAPPVAQAPALQNAPFDGWVRPHRTQRPLLGASLWCFGALFWSYLVVGEIVVWTAVPEILGILAVLATFGLAWHRAISQMPQTPRWRWILPGIIAFFSWLLTLGISTVVFSTGGRTKAELAALLLWSFAGVSYALGRHLTAQQPVPSSTNTRTGRIALWVIAGIATLMAGINIISNA